MAIALARTASVGTLAASPPGPQRQSSKRHGAAASAGQQQHGSGHAHAHAIHSHKLQQHHQVGSGEGGHRRSDKAGRTRRRQHREAPAAMALDSVVLGAMVQG